MPVCLEVRNQGADQPVGFPHRPGFGVRAGPPWDPGELPPRPDPWRPVTTPRGIGEQVPIHRLPHLVGHMQTDGFGQVIAHPPAGLDMRLGRGFDSFTRQPQALPQPFWIGAALMVSGPIRSTTRRGVTLHRPPQPKHRVPLPLHPPARTCVGDVEFQADHRYRPGVAEVWRLGLTAPTRRQVTADSGNDVGARSSHRFMKPTPTDNVPLPHRRRKLLGITRRHRAVVSTCAARIGAGARVGAQPLR